MNIERWIASVKVDLVKFMMGEDDLIMHRSWLSFYREIVSSIGVHSKVYVKILFLSSNKNKCCRCLETCAVWNRNSLASSWCARCHTHIRAFRRGRPFHLRDGENPQFLYLVRFRHGRGSVSQHWTVETHLSRSRSHQYHLTNVRCLSSGL